MKIRAALRSVPGKCAVLLFLFLLLAAGVLLSLKLGSLKLSLPQIIEILWNRPAGIQYQILYNIRLPRILAGALVGAGLAVSGAVLQGVMRNPLAAPGIIGVSSGGVLDFTIGSLTARSWKHLQFSAWYLLAGMGAAFLFSEKLNVLALGDEIAKGLGLHVERVRFIFIALAALLAASAVSIAGLLGFVGLIAPHIVRIVIGSDNRFLLPGSALFGACLVTACDTAGRLVIEPSELPAGIIMALLGPPFFLWLLRGYRYEA